MIVGSIGPGGEGGTFLDWTLHYLSGDPYIKYVYVDRIAKTFVDIVKQDILLNPIKSNGTAHNHRKSHPTEQSIKLCIDNYNLIDDKEINIYSMYIVPSVESYVSGIRSYTDIVRDIADRYKEMKLIHFVYPSQNIENLVKRMLIIPGSVETISEIRQRVNAESIVANKIVNRPNVYSLSIDNMFYNLDLEIRKIFNWLSLPINEERYNSWLDVYKQWQFAQNFYTTIQN